MSNAKPKPRSCAICGIGCYGNACRACMGKVGKVSTADPGRYRCAVCAGPRSPYKSLCDSCAPAPAAPVPTPLVVRPRRTITPQPVPRQAARPDYRPLAWITDPDRACATADPDLFFHPEHETGEPKAYRTKAAKAVCARCPFEITCRDFARETRQSDGVWGGEHEEERKAWLRQEARRAARERVAA